MKRKEPDTKGRSKPSGLVQTKYKATSVSAKISKSPRRCVILPVSSLMHRTKWIGRSCVARHGIKWLYIYYESSIRHKVRLRSRALLCSTIRYIDPCPRPMRRAPSVVSCLSLSFSPIDRDKIVRYTDIYKVQSFGGIIYIYSWLLLRLSGPAVCRGS